MRRSAYVAIFLLAAAVCAAFGQVTISVDAPISAPLGLGLRYSIQVTNTGNTAASALVVTDTLPASASSLSPNCAGTINVVCDIGTLAGGQSASVEMEIVPVAAGTLTNSATVSNGTTSTTSTMVSTNIISNGIALGVGVRSSDATDVVTSSPAGINCNAYQAFKNRCVAFFAPGTQVILTATGPGFTGWSLGTCPGTGTCTITVNSETGVDALYASHLGFTQSSYSATSVAQFPFAVDASRELLGGSGPVTFSVANGALPNGVTLNMTTGLISGIPTTVGTYTATIQALDSTGPTTATLSVNVINPPNTQVSLLNGSYALLFRGVSDSTFGERAVVGSLTFNGGNVSGTIDSNCNGTGCSGPQPGVTVSGTYSIGPDNRGLISLDNGMIFAIVVGEVSNGVSARARIIRFDDITGSGTRGAGELRLQDSAAFSSAMAGTFVFALTGEDPSLNRVVELGLFINLSNNTTSGTILFNDNGTLINQSFTGTYTTPSPIGRTELNTTIGSSTTAVGVGYIVDANNLFFMSLDNGASQSVLAGVSERQANPGTYSSSSLAGPDVINFEGLSGAVASTASEVFLGTLTANAGNLSISFDADNAQLVHYLGSQSGTYSVSASGLAIFTPTGAAGPLWEAYLVGQDHGYAVKTGADPGFGTIDLQAGGPFTTNSLSGNYIFSDREPASPSGGPVSSGIAAVSACTISSTVDQSHASGRLDFGLSGSFGFAVSSGGRLITSFADTEQLGTGNLVGYVISPLRWLIADVDPRSRHPHIVEMFPVSATPPPSLMSIAVSALASSIIAGQTQAYTVTGTYSDQSTKTITTGVNWVSSNLSVATIDSTGTVTGVAAGSADILASVGCLSSAAVALTVTPSTGTLIVQKNTVGGDATFSFTGSGTGMPSTFNITTHSNSGSSQITLAVGSGYSVSEQTQTGWDLSGTPTCTNGTPGNITILSGQTTTCTFTNNLRGRAQVTKSFNGGAIPAGTSFSFQIRSGASPTVAGTILEIETFTSATPGGTILFSSLLVAGQQYQMCEQMMPGWLTTLGPPSYSVFNPSGDNSVVCTNFTPVAGQTLQFTINNQPPPGGMALAIGFWKNWASCANSNGNQKPVLDQVLASFPTAIGQSTHGVYVGNLYVNSCAMAVNILNKSSANGTKEASSPAYGLAAQQLAAELNWQAGAGISTCVLTDVSSANDLLNPVTDTLGNTGVNFAAAFNGNTAPKLSSSQVTIANYLQTQLNQYNNNQAVQCPPAYVY